jgi:NADH-quinone oxidoreductase subunit G
MELHHDANVIHRSVPRENLEINRYWLCDEGRFNFHYTQDPDRILVPYAASNTVDWTSAISQARRETQGSATAVLVGTDLTLEEMELIKGFTQKHLSGAVIQHFGTSGVLSGVDDKAADELLKRTSRTSNLHGAERLGISPFKGFDKQIKTALVFRGGRAELPKDLYASPEVSKVGIGVFFQAESSIFNVVLPSLAFTEKDGTIVNFQGVEQKLKRAVNPRGSSRAVSEILMLWLHSQSNVGVA